MHVMTTNNEPAEINDMMQHVVDHAIDIPLKDALVIDSDLMPELKLIKSCNVEEPLDD